MTIYFQKNGSSKGGNNKTDLNSKQPNLLNGVCVDVRSKSGLNAFNVFLSSKSYIQGYTPTQADAAVFKNLLVPPPDSCPHVLRWYRHIQSFGDSISNFSLPDKVRYVKFETWFCNHGLLYAKSILLCQLHVVLSPFTHMVV